MGRGHNGTNWNMVNRKEKHGRPLRFREAGHQWNASVKPLPPRQSKEDLKKMLADAVKNTAQR